MTENRQTSGLDRTLAGGEIADDRAVLTSTAFHEAGHAVIAVLEKLSVVRVSIEPGDDTLGHITYDTLRFDDKFRESRGLDRIDHAEWEILQLGCERWRAEANARTVLAGEIAERLHAPDVPRSNGADRDLHRFSLWLIELTLDRAERDVYSQLLRMQTERQLRKYWRAVECVAGQLLERRAMDREQLVAVIAPICARC